MNDEVMLQALAVDDAEDLSVDETALTVTIRGAIAGQLRDVRVAMFWLREMIAREGQAATSRTLREMVQWP
jgi:uncharacterized membrane protein